MGDKAISRRGFLGVGSAALGLSLLGPGAVLGEKSVLTGTGVPWGQLQAKLQGTLVLPSDVAYATAKELDLLQFSSINPQAIAYCANPADVALCLSFAQHNDVPIATRSGGHSLGGYSTTRGLVIDVSRLNSITVAGGAVTIGAGAENVDVLNALAPSGLALVGGACPTVAAGGFIQGGGIGFLSPSLGMACDSLTSAQVVLASGQVVTASAQQHSDLYWALRGGGGGNFGVVTSFTLTPSPVINVIASTLVFGYGQAQDMLAGYTQWLIGAPRTIGGAAVITLADSAPGSTPVPTIILVSVGTSSELATETSRLLALTGSPVSQGTSTLPYQAFMMGLYGCSSLTVGECHLSPMGQLPRAAFGVERSRMFDGPIADSGWARALAAFDGGRVAGETHELQVLPAGGAISDLSRSATAYVHRTSQYMVVYSASVAGASATPAQQAGGRQWASKGFAAIDPYSNGETYQNFIDPALAGWQLAYYAENYPRLVAVKTAYDPDRVFRFAQSIA